MKLKYVGLKPDGETAFHDKTGVVWFPGSCHEVKDEIATTMLRHPDVFALDVVAVKQEDPVEEKAPSITLSDGTVKELDGLDKDQLHDLAKELGVTVHHASGAQKVIEALVAAFQPV